MDWAEFLSWAIPLLYLAIGGVLGRKLYVWRLEPRLRRLANKFKGYGVSLDDLAYKYERTDAYTGATILGLATMVLWPLAIPFSLWKLTIGRPVAFERELKAEKKAQEIEQRAKEAERAYQKSLRDLEALRKMQ